MVKFIFDINFEVDNVVLVNFKNLLDIYVFFDLEVGILIFVVELVVDNGEVKGYVKLIFYYVEVFLWKGDIEEDGDGLIEGGIEFILVFFIELFENQSKDQVVICIFFEGNFVNFDISMWFVLGVLIKNVFVKVLSGDVEDFVELDILLLKK